MDNKNKMFSVIIPCYNAEEFIDRAMNSVTDQTLDHSKYEVIAVNDASTDKTLDILRSWEGKYPALIKVISYDTNLRQGGARNTAIRQAEGEYICFLDADDWLEPDALDMFMTGIIDGDNDIITGKLVDENVFCEIPSCENNSRNVSAPVEKKFTYSDKDEFVSYELGYICASIYRRSIVMENDIWFPEHLAYEDIYWQRLVKFYAKSACVIDALIYHHYIHPGSTMNRKNASHHTDRLTCYEMLLREYSERGILKEYYGQILNDAIETYVFNSYFMFFTMMDSVPDVYSRIRSTIYTYFPDWEKVYDDREIPMVFQYLLKFLKKAVIAKPEDLQPFKEAVLEIIGE